MAVYELTSPNGARYRVEGPEGASEADLKPVMDELTRLESDTGEGAIRTAATAVPRGFVESAGSLVEGLGDVVGQGGETNYFQEFGRSIKANARDEFEVNPAREEDFMTQAGGVVGQAAEQAAELALSPLKGAKALKYFGLGSAAVKGADSGEDIARQYGVDDNFGDRLGLMATYGVAEAGAEMLGGFGAEAALAKVLGGEAAETGLKGYLKSALTEAPEEMGTQLAQNFATNLFVSEEEAQAAGVARPTLGEGVFQAGALGLVGGGFMAAPLLLPGQRNLHGAATTAEALGDDAAADVLDQAAAMDGARTVGINAPNLGPEADIDTSLSDIVGDLPDPPATAEEHLAAMGDMDVPSFGDAAAPEDFADEEAPAVNAMDAFRQDGWDEMPEATDTELAAVEAPRTPGEQVRAGFADMADGATKAAKQRIADLVRANGEHVFNSPAAQDAALANPEYRATRRADGSVVVTDVIDPQTGTWVKAGTNAPAAVAAATLEPVAYPELKPGDVIDQAGRRKTVASVVPNTKPGVVTGSVVVTFDDGTTLEGSSFADAMRVTTPAAQTAQTAPAQPAASPMTAPEPQLTPEQNRQQLAYEAALIDPAGRITGDNAERVFDALRELGATTDNVVVNDTGTASNTGPNNTIRGSRRGNTVYLNRNEVRADTPIHEVGHGFIPAMRQTNPELYAQGQVLVRAAGKPLADAIRSRYGRRGIDLQGDDLVHEVLTTLNGNENAAFWQRYVRNPKLVQKIQQWIAKARVWLEDHLMSKGIDPNMTVAEFAKRVNRRVLAGQMRTGQGSGNSLNPETQGSTQNGLQVPTQTSNVPNDTTSTQTTGGPQTPSGKVQNGGGVRGSAVGVEPQSNAPAPGTPLRGLPGPVEIPGRGEVAFGPFATAQKVAADYMASTGRPYNPPRVYAKVNKERAERVAQAYEDMPHNPADPAVAASYRAMIDETLAQYEFIKATGLKVEPLTEAMLEGPGDPYAATPRMAVLDVIENNHMWFFPTNFGFGGTESADVDVSGNPLLEPTGEIINGHHMVANDVFRVVHDYFGHVKEGVGFRANGEENAWRSHSAMYSDLARPAMTSETRGQNSWVNFGKFAKFNKTASGANTQYAPQKTGIMPEWTMAEGAGDNFSLNEPAPTNVSVTVAPVRKDQLESMKPDEMMKRAGSAKFVHLQQLSTEIADAYGVPIRSRQPIIGGWTEDGSTSLEVPEVITFDTDDIELAKEMAAIMAISAPDLQNGAMVVHEHEGGEGALLSFEAKSPAAAMQIAKDFEQAGVQGFSYDPATKRFTLAFSSKDDTIADKVRSYINEQITQNRARAGSSTAGSADIAFPGEGDFSGVLQQARLRAASTSNEKLRDVVARAERRYERYLEGRKVSERAKEVFKELPRPPTAAAGITEDLAGRKFETIRDLGQFLDARFKKKYKGTSKFDTGSARGIQEASKALAYDIVEGLSTDGSGMGWYDERIQETILELTKMHPEFVGNPSLMAIYTGILASTSQGQTVVSNFRRAEEVFAYYKKNGKMPTHINFGPTTAPINSNLQQIQTLVDTYGADGFARFMDEEVLGSALKDQMGSLPSGVTLKEVVRGNRILGPKIGSFFNNLRGRFDTITMDLWYTRSMNRFLGETLRPINNPKLVSDIDRFVEEFKQTPRTYGLKPSDLSTREKAVAAANKIFTKWASGNSGYTTEGYKKFSDGYKIEKLARTIKSGSTMFGAPKNKTERTYFAKVVLEAQKQLKALGFDLSVADMQAIIWYREKNLFADAGVANASSKPADYVDAVMVSKREQLLGAPLDMEDISDPDLEEEEEQIEDSGTEFSLNEPQEGDPGRLPSGVSINQPNTPVREVIKNYTYQGEAMLPAFEEAESIYDDNKARGATFADHLKELVQLTNERGTSNFNMTPGAYFGLVSREQTLIAMDDTRPESEREEARGHIKTLMAYVAEQAASGGQFIKGFDAGLRIANNPTMVVNMWDDLIPFNGSQKRRGKFDAGVQSVNTELDSFAADALNTADDAVIAAATEQKVNDTIRGEDASDAGAAELDAVVTPEIEGLEEDAEITEQDWFSRAVASLNDKARTAVDHLLTLLEAMDMINRSEDFSIQPENERNAERTKAAAEMVRKLRESGLNKKQIVAKLNKDITAAAKKATTKATTPEKQKPASEQTMQEMVVGRLEKQLERLLNPKAKKAPKLTTQKIAAAITSALMTKAGYRNAPAGGDMSLMLGMLLANQSTAAASVVDIHNLLQADETTEGAITRDKLRAFMQLAVGKTFDKAAGADTTSAPFGEKQLANVLRSELNRMDASMTKIVKDAAMIRQTAAQLEKTLRDPQRGLAHLLSGKDLDNTVAAILAQYNKTAAERAAKFRQEQQARQDAKDSKKAVSEAAKDSKSKRREFVRQRRLARRKSRRDLVKANGKNSTPDALNYEDTQELMAQKGEKVIRYLAREFGFDLDSITEKMRPEDRVNGVQKLTEDLADALGLNTEQAQKFVGSVTSAAMKTMDERRKKAAEKRIATVIKQKMTALTGPKKRDVPTEAQRLIKLAEMGGLSAENIEVVLLNSVGARQLSPDFKAKLEEMVLKSNDPNLSQTARDQYTAAYLGMIRSARGISMIGLIGEWTMSNIFMSLNTFKVNYVWGGLKAVADSAVYLSTAPSTVTNADGTKADLDGVRGALLKQYMRGYSGDLQTQTGYIMKSGKSKLESDFTTQFSNSDLETLAEFPDTELRAWANGEPMDPKWAKRARALTKLHKYTRRIMVGTDIHHRTPVMEMLKAMEVVKLIVEQGGTIPNTTAAWTKAIDDVMYGGDFDAAKKEARAKVAAEVASGEINQREAGVRFSELLDEKLGDSLGMPDGTKGLTADKRSELLAKVEEDAKRWTNANQTEGILGAISNNLLAATRDIPGLRYLMPAIRMPINAFAQGLDWSPVGYFRYRAARSTGGASSSVTNYLFNRDGLKKSWNMPAAGVTEERMIDLRTKAALGSAIMIGLYVLNQMSADDDEDKAAFYITGKGPENPQENKLWRQKGYKPFMLRIAGVNINYQESPAFAPLAVLGAWSDLHRYGDPDESTFNKLAFASIISMKSFTEAAVLKNLADVLGMGGGSGFSTESAATGAGKLAGNVASVFLAPRVGKEINTILYGPQSNKDTTWGGRLLGNVPFVTGFMNKPDLNFFGEEIHAERGGPFGEVLPMLAHRVTPLLTDDPQMEFVSRLGAAQLRTSRRFKDAFGGGEVMEDYEFVRKWSTDSGKALRAYLTPGKMASWDAKVEAAKRKPDPKEALKEVGSDFDKEVREIRNRVLEGYRKVQF